MGFVRLDSGTLGFDSRGDDLAVSQLVTGSQLFRAVDPVDIERLAQGLTLGHLLQHGLRFFGPELGRSTIGGLLAVLVVRHLHGKRLDTVLAPDGTLGYQLRLEPPLTTRQLGDVTDLSGGLNPGKLLGAVGDRQEAVPADHRFNFVHPLFTDLLPTAHKVDLFGDRVQTQLSGYGEAIGLFGLTGYQVSPFLECRMP